jgi:hypothetical protein
VASVRSELLPSRATGPEASVDAHTTTTEPTSRRPFGSGWHSGRVAFVPPRPETEAVGGCLGPLNSD